MNNNRLYNLVQTLYTFFKVSFYFWLYLVKGFVFYGFIPASCSLFLTINTVLESKDDENIKQIFNENYKKYEIYRLQSLFVVFLFSFLYVMFIFMSKVNNQYAVIAMIVIGYALMLSAVVYVYCVYYLTLRELSLKEAILLSFVSAIRNIMTSLLLLLIIAAALYLGYLNFAFFVIFVPFLFALSSRFILQNLN